MTHPSMLEGKRIGTRNVLPGVYNATKFKRTVSRLPRRLGTLVHTNAIVAAMGVYDVAVLSYSLSQVSPPP